MKYGRVFVVSAALLGARFPPGRRGECTGYEEVTVPASARAPVGEDERFVPIDGWTNGRNSRLTGCL